MGELAVSALAGAVGGTVVVLGERFLFAGPSAWFGLKLSFRFYRQKFWEMRGRQVTSCPACFRPDPEQPADGSMLPDGWEEEPPGTHWYWCPECQHVWGIRAVITRFFPVDRDPKDQ